MSADYRVDLTIGPTVAGATYTWSINKGDEATLPDVVDGLTVAWQFPDATLWPVQPEPTVATFALVAGDAADLVGIDRGTPVLIRVWAGVVIDGAQHDSLRFVGRVADAEGRAVRVQDPATGNLVDGWLLSLSCSDLTADLGERTVAGRIPFQGFNLRGHVEKTFGLASLTVPNWGDGGGGTQLLIDSETQGLVEPATLAEHVEALLSGYADGGAITGDAAVPANHALYYAQGWRRGIVRPNLDDTTGAPFPAQPWRIEWVSRRYGARPLIGPSGPARFVNLGGGVYGPRLEAPPAVVDIGGIPVPIEDVSIVVDAGYLERQPAKWSRSKFDDPNTVTVTLDTARYPEFAGAPQDAWESATASSRIAGEAVVAGQVTDSRISLVSDAQHVADMYVDDSANAEVIWSAGGLTWRASEDPHWPVVRSLFPDTPLFGEYGAPVVITGIPPTQRPDGRDWYAGVPRSASWTFNRGRFAISFDLYPRVPRPITDAGIGLTWNDLRTDHPTVIWRAAAAGANALSDRFTWVDYRLARTTLYDP